MSSVQLYIYNADLIDAEDLRENFFTEFKTPDERHVGGKMCGIRIYTAYHDEMTPLMRRHYGDWHLQQWDKFLTDIWNLV